MEVPPSGQQVGGTRTQPRLTADEIVKRRSEKSGKTAAPGHYDHKSVQLDGGKRGARLGPRGHSSGDHWHHDEKVVLTMAHDVIISHSHEDKPAADAACAALEARGIRCWIAPRDIDPGQEWAASILQAIQGARIMLLVFSRHANQSPQVKREVERAVHSGKALLPLRIEDVLPEAALEYFLGTPHWLDAITKPFEAHLEKLADACTSLLAVTGLPRPERATSDPATDAATLQGEQPSGGESGSVSPQLWWRRQRRQVQVGLIAATVVILAAGITGYLVWPHSPASPTAQPSTITRPPTTTPPVPPVAEAALDGLLLSPDQINTVMGATGMTVTDSPTVMDDDSAVVQPATCVRTESAADASVYAGSGWSGYRGQDLMEPNGRWAHHVFQAVVLFPSAQAAAAFFTASAQQWPACSNQQYTFTRSGKSDVWVEGPVSDANGTLSITGTSVSPGGTFCQHALTVANNVAIDTYACKDKQSPGDSAVNITHQIAAKVPT